MKFAPVPHLAVPLGTAAATVVAVVPHSDPISEGRRFATLAPLEEASFCARLRQLVDQGVYGRYDGCVMVLRMSANGSRRYAAVLAGCALSRDRHRVATRVPALLGVTAEAVALEALLESESRQRPIFHATAADGTTLTGFLAERPTAILDVLGRCGFDDAPDASLAVVFAGEPAAVPAGLFVELPASAASH